MTFKEYFKLTEVTSKSCIRICTIVFSSFYTSFAILLALNTEAVTSPIKIFIIALIIGNAIAMFVWSLAIFSAFREAKKATRYFKVLPEEIKERFKLRLVEKPLNPKYNYLKFKFINKDGNEPFRFNFNSEFVWITLLNDFSDEENFPKLIVRINDTYKTEKIELGALGLKKKIKWNDWDLMTIEKINTILERLIDVSNKENLKILAKNLFKTDILTHNTSDLA